MLYHISWYFFLELLYPEWSLRSWAYQAHISLQYIEELRHLVNTGLAQYSADRGDSWIVLGRPALLLFLFLLHFHSTELVHLEWPVMKPHPLLLID